MARMISEQEKREKRQKALRAQRTASLEKQGFSAADAKQLNSHLESAQNLVEISKASRELMRLSGGSLPAELKSVELGALEEMEKALLITSKRKDVSFELKVLRAKIAQIKGAQ